MGRSNWWRSFTYSSAISCGGDGDAGERPRGERLPFGACACERDARASSPVASTRGGAARAPVGDRHRARGCAARRRVARRATRRGRRRPGRPRPSATAPAGTSEPPAVGTGRAHGEGGDRRRRRAGRRRGRRTGRAAAPRHRVLDERHRRDRLTRGGRPRPRGRPRAAPPPPTASGTPMAGPPRSANRAHSAGVEPEGLGGPDHRRPATRAGRSRRTRPRSRAGPRRGRAASASRVFVIPAVRRTLRPVRGATRAPDFAWMPVRARTREPAAQRRRPLGRGDARHDRDRDRRRSPASPTPSCTTIGLRWAAALHARRASARASHVATMVSAELTAHFAMLERRLDRRGGGPAQHRVPGQHAPLRARAHRRARRSSAPTEFVDALAAVCRRPPEARDGDRGRTATRPTARSRVAVVIHATSSSPASSRRSACPAPSTTRSARCCCTSGTTGPSKAVVLPWAGVFQMWSWVPLDALLPGEGLYIAMPLFHNSGRSGFNNCMARGGRYVTQAPSSAAPRSGTTCGHRLRDRRARGADDPPHLLRAAEVRRRRQPAARRRSSAR